MGAVVQHAEALDLCALGRCSDDAAEQYCAAAHKESGDTVRVACGQRAPETAQSSNVLCVCVCVSSPPSLLASALVPQAVYRALLSAYQSRGRLHGVLAMLSRAAAHVDAVAMLRVRIGAALSTATGATPTAMPPAPLDV